MFSSINTLFFPALTASLERNSYIILTASPAAVASSSIELFAILKPVRSATIV